METNKEPVFSEAQRRLLRDMEQGCPITKRGSLWVTERDNGLYAVIHPQTIRKFDALGLIERALDGSWKLREQGR